MLFVDMQNLFHSFFSEANAKGAKSTALHSLQWGMGMLAVCISYFLNFGKCTNLLLLIVLAVAFGLVLITFLGAYMVLLRKDPDALRSESYTLSKMAIERGLMGDNQHGLIDQSKANPKAIVVERLISDEGKAK